MSDEKNIEYDYQTTISFLGNLQSICVLMGGFAFTGITLIITLGEPFNSLSQIVLFIMYMGMGMFLGAMYELNNISNLVSMTSVKQIIPIYPTRWRRTNLLMSIGGFTIQFSINLLFLLKNLIPLFVSSLCIAVFWIMWGYLRGWKPVEEKLRRKRILA